MYVIRQNADQVNIIDLVGLCKTQQVIVAFQRLGMISELVAAEVGLFQVQLLYHGTHSTVEYHNALLQCRSNHGGH